MTRLQKIQLLQGIQDGRLSKRILIRPKFYLFTEKVDGNDIFYEIDGRIYSQEEYDDICNEIELDNTNLESLGLKELGTKVITVVYVKGKTIL